MEFDLTRLNDLVLFLLGVNHRDGVGVEKEFFVVMVEGIHEQLPLGFDRWGCELEGTIMAFRFEIGALL